MSSSVLSEATDRLRVAYIKSDAAQISKYKSEVESEFTRAVVDQKPEVLKALAGMIGRLVSAARSFGYQEDAGVWDALSRLALRLSSFPQPGEWRRALDPTKFRGKILRAIAEKPGLRAIEYAQQNGHEENYVSNELAKLERDGFIYRVANGRSKRIYLTDTARRRLGEYDAERMLPMPQIFLVDRETERRVRPAAHWVSDVASDLKKKVFGKDFHWALVRDSSAGSTRAALLMRHPAQVEVLLSSVSNAEAAPLESYLSHAGLQSSYKQKKSPEVSEIRAGPAIKVVNRHSSEKVLMRGAR